MLKLLKWFFWGGVLFCTYHAIGSSKQDVLKEFIKPVAEKCMPQKSFLERRIEGAQNGIKSGASSTFWLFEKTLDMVLLPIVVVVLLLFYARHKNWINFGNVS